MQKKKILHITTELDPFLAVSSLATIAKEMVQTMGDEKWEVRVMMPKFGMISDRRNRIHEIQRLYGINIRLEEENISLIVKVAPITRWKIQVYFIDNEDLFENQRIFHDEEGVFYANNHIRVAFMCKAAWAILRNLGWAPDIIHCFGWPWALVPFYGRKYYKKMPLFKDIKFVYTHNADFLKEKLDNSFVQKAYMHKIKTLDFYPLTEEVNFENLLIFSQKYADKTTYSYREAHNPALPILEKLGAECIPPGENLAGNYKKIYAELLQEQEEATPANP